MTMTPEALPDIDTLFLHREAKDGAALVWTPSSFMPKGAEVVGRALLISNDAYPYNFFLGMQLAELDESRLTDEELASVELSLKVHSIPHEIKEFVENRAFSKEEAARLLSNRASV